MNKLEQLKKALNDRLGSESENGLDGVKIDIRQDSKVPTTIRIQASRMYDYVPLNFSIMKLISEILETDNIDDAQRYCEPGCDTCDYGSSYEWTLVCKDCKL
jgi:hypothetical protein